MVIDRSTNFSLFCTIPLLRCRCGRMWLTRVPWWSHAKHHRAQPVQVQNGRGKEETSNILKYTYNQDTCEQRLIDKIHRTVDGHEHEMRNELKKANERTINDRPNVSDLRKLIINRWATVMIFIQMSLCLCLPNLQGLESGWRKYYNFRCQPVDYSTNPIAVRVSKWTNKHVVWIDTERERETSSMNYKL